MAEQDSAVCSEFPARIAPSGGRHAEIGPAEERFEPHAERCQRLTAALLAIEHAERALDHQPGCAQHLDRGDQRASAW